MDDPMGAEGGEEGEEEGAEDLPPQKSPIAPRRCRRRPWRNPLLPPPVYWEGRLPEEVGRTCGRSIGLPSSYLMDLTEVKMG